MPKKPEDTCPTCGRPADLPDIDPSDRARLEEPAICQDLFHRPETPAAVLLEALLLRDRNCVAGASQVLDVMAENRTLTEAAAALLETLTEKERTLLEGRFELRAAPAGLPATDATLATRDGRVVGNAIVTRVEDGMVFAKTDYGNDVGPLTPGEVRELWRVGPLNPEHKYASAGGALAASRADACEALVKKAARQGDLLRDLVEALDALLKTLKPTTSPSVSKAADRCRNLIAEYVKKIAAPPAGRGKTAQSPYDRRSPHPDERDPDCRACQEAERYNDHTCEVPGVGPLQALLPNLQESL